MLRAKYDSVFVGDWKRGADDAEVIMKAIADNRVIVTEDKDFGKLVFKLHLKLPGVVLFRTKTTNPYVRLSLLERVLAEVDPYGKFIMIAEESIRIREPSGSPWQHVVLHTIVITG